MQNNTKVALIVGVAILIMGLMISQSMYSLEFTSGTNNMGTGEIGSSIDELSSRLSELKNEIENKDNANDEVLTLDEAADYLGVSPEVLRKLLEEKNADISHVLINGQLYLFHKEALKEWLTSGRKAYNLTD